MVCKECGKENKSTTFAPDTKKHPVAPSFEIFIDETLKIIDFQEKKI